MKYFLCCVMSVLLVAMSAGGALANVVDDPEIEDARKVLEDNEEVARKHPQLFGWLLAGGGAALLARNVYLSAKVSKISQNLKRSKGEVNVLATKMADEHFQLKPIYDKSPEYIASFNAELKRIADNYVYSVPRYVQSKHPGLWKVQISGKEMESLKTAQSLMDHVFSNMEVTYQTVLLRYETPKAYFKRVVEPHVDQTIRYALARQYEYSKSLSISKQKMGEMVGLVGRKEIKNMFGTGAAVKAMKGAAVPLGVMALVAVAPTSAQAQSAAMENRLKENPALFFRLSQDEWQIVAQNPLLRSNCIDLARSLKAFSALDIPQQENILRLLAEKENTIIGLHKARLVHELRRLQAR